VDKCIKTMALLPVRIGDNVLEAAIPFGRHTNLEWVYLLGALEAGKHIINITLYGHGVMII